MTNTNVSESASLFAGEGSSFDLEAEIALINDQTIAAKKHEAEGHQRTYQRLADMFRFVLRVHNNPQYAEAWKKVLTERQITKPEEGVNEFYQYTKALAGSYVTTTSKKRGFEGESVTRWVAHCFSETAAKVVRWCVENDVQGDEAADRIANYVNPKNAKEKGKVGILKADTRAHPPSAQRVSKLKAAEQKAIREAEGICTLPSEAGSHMKPHGGYSLVIVRHDDDCLVVLGDAGLSANQVINAVKRRKDAITAEKA